jgi:hypothetical protein
MTNLKGHPTVEIPEFCRELVEPNRGAFGYSEPSLKRALTEAAPGLASGRIVDLGCDPNPVVLYSLGRSGWEVYGVALSADFCESAAERPRRRSRTAGRERQRPRDAISGWRVRRGNPE